MKKSWKVLLAVVVIVVAVTTVVSVAVAWPSGATEPLQKSLRSGAFNISGTFSGVAAVDDAKPYVDAETNTMVMVNIGYNQVHGSFEGINRVENVVTLDLTTGTFTLEGVGYFTGTLNGVAGTLVAKETGSGQFSDDTGLNYTLHGESAFAAGTGGLASVIGGSISFDEKVVNGADTPVAYGGTIQVK